MVANKSIQKTIDQFFGGQSSAAVESSVSVEEMEQQSDQEGDSVLGENDGADSVFS